jgi:hypothetical protein
MKETKEGKRSRREFIRNSSVAAAGFFIVPRHLLGRGFVAPSDKLMIAAIGAGGKGADDIDMFNKSGKAVIAVLCDVDDRQAADARKKFPQAKYYKDFREMLTREGKSIEAVSVSTPDHTHAVAAMAAMQLGKHVYVQKPLTHDIYEARMLTQAAHRYKVVTQMGNQGASGDGVRQLQDFRPRGCAYSLLLSTPLWPQGIQRLIGFTIPSELILIFGWGRTEDYFDGLLPSNWRGWWDYETGGDMGPAIYGLRRCFWTDTRFLQNAVLLQDMLKTGTGGVFPGVVLSHRHP